MFIILESAPMTIDFRMAEFESVLVCSVSFSFFTVVNVFSAENSIVLI
jgi:hypothetical protein